MATEKAVIGQAQRVLVDATNKIWHKISTWTHASDVEMPDGEPLNEYLTDLNDSINDRFDGKYNSYNFGTTAIGSLDAIPEIGYSRIQTIQNITAGDYTIPINHTCYCYSGQDPASIEKMAVMIDTTDLTSIVMYIAHYSREARWTLTKIATQKQIDNLQMQIDELNSAFNQLNLFVQQSVGDLNARYQIIQDQMDWLEAELAELQEFLNDLLNELRDFKAEARGKISALEAMFRHLYGPVGSLFMTTSRYSFDGRSYKDVLPEIFGGTWKLVQNGYLYAGGYVTISEYGEPVRVGEEWWPRVAFEENSDSWPGNIRANGGDAELKALGADRNFERMFLGHRTITLKKTNLPEHLHRAGHGEYGYSQMKYIIGKYPIDDPRSVEIAKEYPVNPDYNVESDYVGVIYNYKNAQRSTPSGGVHFWGDTVGSNKFPGEELSEPLHIEPTQIQVWLWAKVAY